MMEQLPCLRCQEWLVPFIDNQIDDSATFNEIAFHLQDCLDCRNQLEIERRTIDVMRSLLARTCCETAPTTLQERIAHQLHLIQMQQMAGFGQTEIITQYRRTEITIDGQTQIEIETSHEIRRDFPLE
ncbi:MAG: anti-sigma factor family protein [Actinomycetales bacterium]|jgi:mycothiol system anti-sigma-R factor